jgi:transposase-like protein
MAADAIRAVPSGEDDPGHCPTCRVGTLVRVEHQAGARRSYDRFFCPRCGSSVEVFGDEQESGPRASEA